MEGTNFNVALMYVASAYKSNDLLNWQFEREEDKLINFNFNELHCPVFIIVIKTGQWSSLKLKLINLSSSLSNCQFKRSLSVCYAEGFCLCLLLGSKNTQKQHIDDILLLFNSSYEQLEGESLRHLMVSFFLGCGFKVQCRFMCGVFLLS